MVEEVRGLVKDFLGIWSNGSRGLAVLITILVLALGLAGFELRETMLSRIDAMERRLDQSLQESRATLTRAMSQAQRDRERIETQLLGRVERCEEKTYWRSPKDGGG